MPISSTLKTKILAGRDAVDTYRVAHANLYLAGWYKGISEAHTPLLNTMLADLKKQGFNLLDGFFGLSEELNIQTLGYKDRADFEARATQADREVLERMWK